MKQYETINIGTEGFAIIDDEIVSFKVDFVGKDSLLMESEDGYISCKKEDFEVDASLLKKKQKANQLVVLCRECSKDYGKCIAYTVETEITDSLLFSLNIRSRYNPELRYFIALRSNITDKIFQELVDNPEELIEENLVYEV